MYSYIFYIYDSSKYIINMNIWSIAVEVAILKIFIQNTEMRERVCKCTNSKTKILYLKWLQYFVCLFGSNGYLFVCNSCHCMLV